MPGPEDFVPLFAEALQDITDRMDADANAGLAPDDERWADLVEGGFLWDMRMIAAQEIERLWDAVATDLPASAFIATGWGEYLDLHGAVLGVERNDAAKATGEVLITAPDGTFIAQGAEVAVALQDPAADDIVFVTTEDRTVTPLGAPENLTATPGTAGGSLENGTYYWVVTAVNDNGETVASAEATATVTEGPKRVLLAWSAIELPDGAAEVTAYRVYRGTAEGGPYKLVDSSATNSYEDLGPEAGEAEPPSEDGSGGTVTAPVEAEEAGSGWNVADGSVSLLETPIAGVAAVTNPQAITGGAEVETDEDYRERLELEITAEVGGGTIVDYERWCLANPSVGHVKVEPLWNGAGTVRCSITDPENNPNSESTVEELQEELDPVAGEGRGRAPIGHVVTVATPTAITVDVAATVEHETGYSLDGSGGELATRDAIEAAVTAYVNGLGPNDDVLVNEVLAAIISVEGVYNVSGVELDGEASDAVVGEEEIAAVGTIVLAAA